MNNKQVLVYGLLESTNDVRSIFVGHIHFKRLIKFRKFVEIFEGTLMQILKYFKIFVFIWNSSMEISQCNTFHLSDIGTLDMRNVCL